MIKSTYGTMYYVDSMSKSVEFFKRTLGVNPGYQSDDWTEFQMGEHRLCLHAKRPNETFPANGILIMNHDGIKGLYESMKNDGYNVFGLHQVHPEAWSFHMKDVSQNELSFFGKP